MLFAPHVKPKRCDDAKRNIQPFPPCEDQEIYEGTFTGISVEVSSKCGIAALFNNGFYGKGSHSRSVPSTLLLSSSRSQCDETLESKETLSLSLEEAFYLSFCLKVLTVSNICGDRLEWPRFLTGALKVNSLFLESLAAFIYLKSKGWVVKSGIKFGGDFLIYRKGPRYYHASFVVAVVSSSKRDHLKSSCLKCFQRIAETSHKDVLILEVSKPTNHQMENIEGISQLNISETVIRRFNYTSFVQHQINAT